MVPPNRLYDSATVVAGAAAAALAIMVGAAEDVNKLGAVNPGGPSMLFEFPKPGGGRTADDAAADVVLFAV